MAGMYGMPYKGSKQAIADTLIAAMPPADYFVDLFGGGGAMAHCAALSGKYKHVIYNELETVIYNGFKKAIAGEYNAESRWISREDFQRLKDTDPYAAMCFSFGTNLRNYAYSKEVEPWEKALHYAYAFGDLSEFEKFGIYTDGTRADIIKHHDEYKAQYVRWYMRNVMKSDREYKLEKAELERNIKEESDKLRTYLINARDAAGLKSSEVDRYLGTNGMAGHYFGRSQWEFPTREVYEKLQKIMPALDQDYDDVIGLASLWQSLQSLQRLQSLQSLQRLQSLERLQRLQSLERLESLQRLQRLQRLEIECYNLSYEQVPIPDNSVIYCDIPYNGTDEYISEFNHDVFWKWAREQSQPLFVSEYNAPKFLKCVESVSKTSPLGSGNNCKTMEKLFTNQKYKYCEQLSFFEVM